MQLFSNSKFKIHFFNFFLISAVALIVFREPLMTGTMPLHTDGQFMTFPALSYFKHWALRGAYPVWWVNGSVAGNMADTGSVGPAFILFMPVLLLMRTETAWFVMIFSMYWLAGICMYLYLFRMTRHSFASVFGAVLFMRGEWVVDCLVEPQIQFYLIPLTLLWMEKLIRKPKAVWAFLISISCALFFLGSNVNYPLYLIPCLFLYYFVCSAQCSQQRPQILKLWLYGAACAFLFLSLIWFRPYMLAAIGRASTRETLAQTLPNYLNPICLIASLFPDFFTSPHIQFPYLFDRFMQALSMKMLGHPLRFLEMAYPGLFAVFFLVASSSALRKRSWILSHWITFSLTMFYVLGGEMLLYPILRRTPLLNMVVNTQRISSITTFTIPILAAAGLAYCLSDEGQTAFSKWRGRFAALLGILFSFFLIKAVLVFAFESGVKSVLIERAIAFIHSRPVYTQPDSFYRERLNEFFLWFNTWADLRSAGLLLPFIFYAIGYALWKCSRRVGTRFFGASVFFVLLVVDGFILHPLSFNTLVSRTDPYPLDAVTQFLRSDLSLFRFMSLKPEGEPRFPWGHSQYMPADKQLVYGLQSVHGYQALQPKRYADVFKLLTRVEKLDSIRLHDAFEFEPRIANLLNVKYVVTPAEKSIEGWPEVFSDQRYRVFKNKDAFPRVFLVPNAVWVRDAEESLARLSDKTIDLRQTALLEGVPDPLLRGGESIQGSDTAVLAKYTPMEIVIDVKTQTPRILILGDSFHPAWKVEIDGRPALLYPAYHAFRGAVVPGGSHRVRFYLHPFPYAIYFSGVFAAAILLAACFHFTLRSKKEKYEPAKS